MVSKVGKYIAGVIFFTFFVQQVCYAQKDEQYIGSFTQDITARTFISQMFTVLTYEDKDGNKVDYKPNSPLNIGLGFSYKKIGFSASYGVNLASNKNKGKTKALELQYHYYGRKIMFDLFLHRYRGFYIDTDYPKDDVYVQRPDISMLQLGFFGQYVFNGDKFSYNAAFDQNEKQKKSVGSLQVGTGLYYNQVRADSSLLKNTQVEPEKDITHVNNIQLGVSVGYSYTWVLKRFHITAAIAVGCNFGVMDIKNYKASGIDIYPSIFPRFATGYNAKTWSLNLQVYTNLLYTTFTTNDKMSLSTGNAQLTFIKRFNSPQR